MKQGPKQPIRTFAPRFRGKAPRFQRRKVAGDGPSRPALRALVRLLARQAAEEVMDGSGTPPMR